MRRIRRIAGVLLFALALVMPPIESPAVPSVRAAADPPSPCAPTTSSAVVSPVATWTLAPTGPKLVWQRAAFAPTTCQLVAFGGNDPFKGTSNDTWLFDPAFAVWARIAGTRAGRARGTSGSSPGVRPASG